MSTPCCIFHGEVFHDCSSVTLTVFPPRELDVKCAELGVGGDAEPIISIDDRDLSIAEAEALLAALREAVTVARTLIVPECPSFRGQSATSRATT